MVIKPNIKVRFYPIGIGICLIRFQFQVLIELHYLILFKQQTMASLISFINS